MFLMRNGTKWYANDDRSNIITTTHHSPFDPCKIVVFFSFDGFQSQQDLQPIVPVVTSVLGSLVVILILLTFATTAAPVVQFGCQGQANQ